VFGSPISLTSATGIANFAFVAPYTGTITDISATFTVVAATSIGLGNTYVQVQLYSAPAGSTTFSPAGSVLTLSPGVSLLTVGELLTGNMATSIPVTQGDQLLLVFGAYSDGGILVLAGSINGYASAGIAIS